jgi:hypothetical protein
MGTGRWRRSTDVVYGLREFSKLCCMQAQLGMEHVGTHIL